MLFTLFSKNNEDRKRKMADLKKDFDASDGRLHNLISGKFRIYLHYNLRFFWFYIKLIFKFTRMYHKLIYFILGKREQLSVVMETFSQISAKINSK